MGLGRKRRLSKGIFLVRKILRTNFQSTCSLKQVKTVNKAFIALLNLVRYTPALSEARPPVPLPVVMIGFQ